ncbi:MAG: CCA tRNA nucleotidyltransferase [Bdellovibrio sp.]|nr:CCA tRNA nucleotidyltransferase [Bdellovibrio sp.]
MTSASTSTTANSTVAYAFEKHALYSEFLVVKNKLSETGFVCWVAGGAVRDFLIGRPVADFDLVTDATTEQIMQIFPDALTVGASFGVVKLVLKDKSIFDLATFRRESDYVDGRRPSHVDFATPEEDAGRRDFTVNALFWDDQKKQVVDFVQGLNDIDGKFLKCVGDADVRFQEDHLRILRLLRFSIQFGFSCDQKTLSAALTRVPLLKKISGERIWAEFKKMIPFVKWNDFFQQPLASQIFDFIFGTAERKNLESGRQFPDFFKLENAHGLKSDAFQRFFLVLMTTYVRSNRVEGDKSMKTLKQILKDRLKIGADDLKVFDALVFAYQNREHKLAYPQWAVEMEKSPLIGDSLQFLEKIELFDSDLLKRLMQTKVYPPVKLVDGNDLLGVVEKEKIGDYLKKIRLLQFEQPGLSKSELLKNLGIDKK